LINRIGAVFFVFMSLVCPLSITVIVVS
jgi:hypothetical protein